MQLMHKVALVTGGADGIGKAIAKRFKAEGAKVVIADVDAAKGEALAKEIGGDAIFVTCDVGDKASVEAAVKAAVDSFGSLDIAVPNAGIIHTADFLDISEEDFDRVIRVNLKGVFLTGQAAARQMAKQGTGGAIVNMSSVNGVFAIPNQVPYCTSKGGVGQLTKVMALALTGHDIRVNAVGPGSIATDMLKNAILTDDAARRKVMSRTPMGRLGEPGEIAAVVTFLASDQSSYITGETIYADGGRLPLNYTVEVPE